MANSYLSRTPSGAGSRVKWTYSVWLKRSKLGHQPIWAATTDGNNYDEFYFNSSDKIQFSTVTSSSQKAIRTTKVFRDTSAWYHIVLVYDTGNSTDTDHAQLWINGVRETSFEDTTLLASGANNVQSNWNNTIEMKIGRVTTNTAAYFEGYMSHAAFVNDAVIAPTVFGQTDSTSGIWKFKPPSGVTWGTNGFHLKFENSGNLGLDSSGNTNNFTVNGNLKQALDTPSNVSATLTPLAKSNGTLTNGNTTWAPSGNNASVWSSIAVNSGKWYFEMKKTSGDAALSFSNTPKFNGFDSGSDANSMTAYMYYSSGGASNNRFRYNSTNTGFPSGFGDDDVGTIYGVTMDFTNDEIIIRRNNDDSTKATFSIPAALKAEPIHVGYSVSSTWPAGSFDFNFGNGFFGTTAITSAGSNGNGSLFEYDVPSGFYALNTKNINTYG
jgi:hypothetical protein